MVVGTATATCGLRTSAATVDVVHSNAGAHVHRGRDDAASHDGALFSVEPGGPQQAFAFSLSQPVKGHQRPRMAPPRPRRTGLRELVHLAVAIGYNLFPWQQEASRYLTATTTDGYLLYREVAVIVARQNGKTTLLVPLIVARLLAGKRIMHTAQNRELPREVFGLVADIFVKQYPSLLRSRPRFANGQEEIRLINGGHYRIVAPTRGGARGPSNDLVIIDELREMTTLEFIAAAKPTLVASSDAQIVYLSNAGTNESVVLNALRTRAKTDTNLAYLEWSAAPNRDADDRAGWREANPAIGFMPGILGNLESEYTANVLGGTLAIFETEHLCRWAASLRATAFRRSVWEGTRTPTPLLDIEEPYALGIGVAPGWARATIAVAALRPDGRIGVEIYRDLREDVGPRAITAAVDDFALSGHWPQVVAYDASSGGAGEFMRHGQESGYTYDPLGPKAMTMATMDATEMIMAGRLAVDDPLLDFQIELVVKRMVGPDGAFRFSRADSLGPIDAVEAMTLAAHAIAFLQQPGLH